MEGSDHQVATASIIKATTSTEISATDSSPKSPIKNHRKSKKNGIGSSDVPSVVNGILNGANGKSEKDAKLTHQKHVSKRSQNVTMPSVSSKDILSGIQMAVIDHRYPEVELNRKQAELIQTKLVVAIDEVTIETSPKFQQTKFELGILWITCADQSTQEWLKQIVPNLQGLWEEASLAVVEDTDLPKRTKFVVWIPEAVNEEVIRSRLKKQNDDLETENWLVLKRKVKENWQTLAYSIDEQSTEALEKLNFRPYYSLGRVIFKKMGLKYKFRKDQATASH